MITLQQAIRALGAPTSRPLPHGPCGCGGLRTCTQRTRRTATIAAQLLDPTPTTGIDIDTSVSAARSRGRSIPGFGV